MDRVGRRRAKEGEEGKMLLSSIYLSYVVLPLLIAPNYARKCEACWSSLLWPPAAEPGRAFSYRLV